VADGRTRSNRLRGGFRTWVLLIPDTLPPLALRVGAARTEAIAPFEYEATQTDWPGDLSGGLGADPAACGCRRRIRRRLSATLTGRVKSEVRPCSLRWWRWQAPGLIRHHAR